ncbi:o-succinylbenzoate synthase [Ligilactobacillus pobuzihii]|uniref:o-succinylbenzoate synthase n=1 Tax=Ligilactobacillus pobuzihii TaxID=449659 RepID=UPI0019D29B2F|nr:o-succinylbenzoate synthase [Ligilactobacillus pobuzihii]MBN7274967.1 o-succinylbenzoate synthase [Ligilactobacillus pobuzihii]
MKIVDLRLLPVVLSLKQPFVSSHETLTQRELTVIELTDASGLRGYGELEAFSQPFYTRETQVTARWVIKNVLESLLVNVEFDQPEDLYAKLAPVKGNHLAKAAVDSAAWDLFAKQQQLPLADVLAQKAGTTRKDVVKVGISIGILPLEQTIRSVECAIKQEYGRIKLKVQGNDDLQRIAAVREYFPSIQLCIDANGSLKPAVGLAEKIDALQLTMLEDPFSMEQHEQTARLQAKLKTDLCYDEPIESVADAIRAIKAKECRVISMKTSVLGGLTPALEMVAAHKRYGFPIWCGGMVEGGLGRATNLALASLDEFAFPGDISETARYYEKDYARPEFVIQHGAMQVPTGSGTGVELCSDLE